MPEPCPYIRGRLSTMEHIVVESLTTVELEALLELGWRKFGRLLYRPVCHECSACRSTRIYVPKFTPNRSQLRCIVRNADLRIETQTPIIDDQRMKIYRRYHRNRESTRAWGVADRSFAGYEETFLDNLTEAIEVSVWLESRLLGVALTDITGNIVSGVYHYHDPDYQDRSIGKFLMLKVIRLAELTGRRWAHFGYHVEECISLQYKTSFRPVSLLGNDGVWRMADANGNYDEEGLDDSFVFGRPTQPADKDYC